MSPYFQPHFHLHRITESVWNTTYTTYSKNPFILPESISPWARLLIAWKILNMNTVDWTATKAQPESEDAVGVWTCSGGLTDFHFLLSVNVEECIRHSDLGNFYFGEFQESSFFLHKLRNYNYFSHCKKIKFKKNLEVVCMYVHMYVRSQRLPPFFWMYL